MTVYLDKAPRKVVPNTLPTSGSCTSHWTITVNGKQSVSGTLECTLKLVHTCVLLTESRSKSPGISALGLEFHIG